MTEDPKNTVVEQKTEETTIEDPVISDTDQQKAAIEYFKHISTLSLVGLGFSFALFEKLDKFSASIGLVAFAVSLYLSSMFLSFTCRSTRFVKDIIQSNIGWTFKSFLFAVSMLFSTALLNMFGLLPIKFKYLEKHNENAAVHSVERPAEKTITSK
jgi:hypothetical protein